MKHIYLSGVGSLPALGFGCMGMSEFYGPAQAHADSLDVLNAAHAGGIRLFDTADFYGNGDNEELLGRFLRQCPDGAVIATKCGIVRGREVLDDGNFRREINGRPDYIRSCCEASLKRLGVEKIDLLYLHRIDPQVPVEESVGAMADLIAAGKIAAYGLSEASVTDLRRAHAIHPVAALQSEYSLWTRDVETDILPTCRSLGIAFVAYSPLGRGIMPIQRSGTELAMKSGDFRLTLERSTAENLDRNRPLFNLLFDIADSLELTPFQVMLSWILSQGPDILAIPGMRQLRNLDANLVAAGLELPSDVLDRLSEAFRPGSVSGGRYTVDRNVSTTLNR